MRWHVARCLTVCLALSWAALTVAAGPSLRLLPGEYLWTPELAPVGPVLVLVSLPEQRAYVYRNGVRIGVTTASTGKPGHETPTGVFSVLQKKREHYSNLYDDAPMPFMQRLTWDGIALHAGRIPGYPASHGCIRLPEAFAEKLYEVTARGMTVVITDDPARVPMLADPSLFPATPLPQKVGTRATDLALPVPADAGFSWQPGLAPPGQVTVVLSLADREMVVMREGVELGRAPVRLPGPVPAGTRAYLMLEGLQPDAGPSLPERPRRRWLRVLGDGGDDPASVLGPAGLDADPRFLARVYDLLVPGATLVVTDEPLRRAPALTVLEAGDEIQPGSPHAEGQ
ncbi:L,D-transpeptidase [Arenimonas sp.]|uniref:L,D-transpeptidase n=1 Tax=Arenimonas sp. TaxID=1872635 RepID=UPI0035AFC107